LRVSLAEYRRTGLAVVREEISPDSYWVVRRITDATDRVVAVLSVVGADPATHLLVPAVVMAGLSTAPSPMATSTLLPAPLTASRTTPQPQHPPSPVHELEDINTTARSCGNDVILDALLLRLHTETVRFS
jgi:hypothetical protein